MSADVQPFAYAALPGGRTIGCAAFLASVTAFTAPLAHAQLVERYFPANIPAYQDWEAAAGSRAQDAEYQPTGIRVGSFVLRPEIDESIGYDSNLGGSARSLGSAFVQSNARLSAVSDWARNGVGADIGVQDRRTLDVPKYSYTDWNLTLSGALEVAGTALRTDYVHLTSVTLPTDAGTLGLAVPVVDDIETVRVSDTWGRGRITVVPSLVGQAYRFSNLFGGVPASSPSLFDRDAGTGSLTSAFQFAGGHNLLLVVSDTDVIYQSGLRARPADYDDASILAGIEYRLPGNFTYRALAGYDRRFERGHGVHTGRIEGPAAELDASWTPTRLTTLTAQISQGIVDEPTSPAQGLTQTSATLTADDQIRRFLDLRLTTRYARAAFRGGGRVQNTIAATAEASYLFNRAVSLSLQYDFEHATDNEVAALRFDRSTVILQVRLQR